MPEWTREITNALTPLALRPEREREIADELAAHLEDRYCDARGRGASDADARKEALAELSGVLVPELRRVESSWRAPEQLGAAARASMLDTLRQDVRYAMRSLRLSPGFTAVSVATLAIGIGACTLMLSAANSVLRRPLPFREPDRLVVFWGTAPEKGLTEVDYPTGLAAVVQDRTHTLESFAVFTGTGVNLTGDGDAERLDGAAVSADFFRTIGVSPMLGRVPVASEAVLDEPSRVVVVGHSLWMRRFGGDSSLVGKTIDLNGSPTTVIGVMPPGFVYPRRSEMWSPLAVDPSRFNCWCFTPIGRMRPGVTSEDVRRDVTNVVDDFAVTRQDVFPGAKRGNTRVIAMSLSERVVGGVEKQLLTLLVAVGCVLLVACANIANLLLARAATRARELAVRCCLGASPRRVATQLLTESTMIALAGAALGATLAAWGVHALRGLPTTLFPRIDEVRIDVDVLLATIAVAVVTGVLCGLAPAWRAMRVDLLDAIKGGAKVSSTRASRRTSNGFVVAQFALSLMLLVSAGLLLRSYHRLSNVEMGYRADHALIARLQLPYPRYDSARVVRATYQQLLDQAQAIPGVTAVGLASRVPLSMGNPQDNVIAEGKEPANPNVPIRVANVRFVTPGYFAAMGTPLRRGRLFRASDDDRSPRVAVVDELFANFFWPGEDPIGKRFMHGGDTSAGRWLTVIGVVPNVKHERLDEAGDLQVYEHFAQRTTWNNYIVVRTGAEPESFVPQLRALVRKVDPAVPLYEVHSMRDAVDLSLGTRRLTNILLVSFAITGMLLAAIGIYGVMSLGVSNRVREFGIRLALGAKPDAVRGLVLRQAVVLAAVGIAAGLAGAIATTRYIRGLLFGVEPLDWTTFAAVSALLAVAALTASYLPARRATRADPMVALKAE
jgi:predicted permease